MLKGFCGILLIGSLFKLSFAQDSKINVRVSQRIVYSHYIRDGAVFLENIQFTRALGPWFERTQMSNPTNDSTVTSWEGSSILLLRNQHRLRIYGEGESEINRFFNFADPNKAHGGLSHSNTAFTSTGPVGMRVSVALTHFGLQSLDQNNYAHFRLRGPKGFVPIEFKADQNTPENGIDLRISGPAGTYFLLIEARTRDPFEQGLNWLKSTWWIEFEAFTKMTA